MKIKLTSVYVDDQEKALRFYTEVLGFNKKADVRSRPSSFGEAAPRRLPSMGIVPIETHRGGNLP